MGSGVGVVVAVAWGVAVGVAVGVTVGSGVGVTAAVDPGRWRRRFSGRRDLVLRLQLLVASLWPSALVRVSEQSPLSA